MHHSAIPVETNERFQALVRVAPAHLKNFLAGAAFACAAEAPLSPLIESMKMLHGATGVLIGHHVDKRVSKACSGVKIDWQINEIKHRGKAHCIKDLHESLPREAGWQIPEHDGCATVKRPSCAHLRSGV